MADKSGTAGLAGGRVHAAGVQAEGTHAWDMKHIVRTIVTSHDLPAVLDEHSELDERDPDNRLLARQSRFRVDAEVVHDIAL